MIKTKLPRRHIYKHVFNILNTYTLLNMNLIMYQPLKFRLSLANVKEKRFLLKNNSFSEV